MFKARGSTLIETLFAFSIYIVVIVQFVSLIALIHQSNLKLNKLFLNYDNEEYERCLEFQDVIEMVLR